MNSTGKTQAAPATDALRCTAHLVGQSMAERRARWAQLVLLLALVVSSWSSVDAQENLLKGQLLWNNGDKIPGSVVSGTEQRLHWQAKLFRDPLDLDLSYLKQINFNAQSKLGKTKEIYSVQTVDGFSLFGEIEKLDENVLGLVSKRFGRIEIDRTRIATLLNLQTSGSLINGEFDLNNWDAYRNDKKYWQVSDQGELECLRRNAHLFLKTELPDSVLIEVELNWEKKLDFIFGFGVPKNSRKIESLPRLESWDDAVVLIYNDDEFEIVVESNESDIKRLKFLIHWNRKLNKIVIHDEQGRQMATADLGKPKNVSSGIYLENKSGDLKVTSLMIRRSAAGFVATEPSIQALDRPAINGKVSSFDGTDWTITTEGSSPSKISAAEFCGAFLMNPPQPRPEGRTRVKFRDGMYVSGELLSLEGNSISMQCNFAKQPLLLQLEGATYLKFDASQNNEPQGKFTHRLFNNAGEIQGRLEKGSGEQDDILRWRVAGAQSAVPLSAGDARIVLQKKKTIVSVDEQWADTLYLANRDTIPCRVIGIDGQTVTIESFTEFEQIDQNLVKAVDLRGFSLGERIAVGDRGWVIPKKSKKRVVVADAKMKLTKDAEFGHPHLLASGGFEFDLVWDRNSYGILECHALVNSIGSSEGGKKFNIMLYGENLFVCNAGESNPGQGMIPGQGRTQRIKVELKQGKLIVKVNGKTAYSEKVPAFANRGRGVQFRLNDMHRQNIKCTLSKFEQKFSSTGNGVFIDENRKELLLTIPRLKKKSPPKQILCATNTDMVRGEVISMNDEFVSFRANHEVKRFPRKVVSSVVWLHADSLKQTDAPDDPSKSEQGDGDDANPPTMGNVPKTETVQTATPTDSPDDSMVGQQTAQVLMQGGRRMTATLESWANDKLRGRSAALGKCDIPIDQIYELRFGAFATQATDVPYSDWVAKMAPAPKLETGPDGDAGSPYVFGSASPLIGTTPKSFSATRLDGRKVSLSSQKGKIVVLDFWATWCGPCVQALPKMERVISDYSPDQVVLLAVNQEESAEQIKEFLASRDLALPVVLDSGSIGKQFQVNSLPQTIIINQQGEVAFVKVGNSSDLETKLKAALDSLIDEQATEDETF